MAKKAANKSPQEQVLDRGMFKIAQFKKLANKRVNAAIKRIQLVGNLSNKSAYTYTLEEADKIAEALEAAVVEACGRFRSGPSSVNTFQV